jgi:hypothetical protein
VSGQTERTVRRPDSTGRVLVGGSEARTLLPDLTSRAGVEEAWRECEYVLEKNNDRPQFADARRLPTAELVSAS